MHLRSSAETVAEDAVATHLGFDLAGSEAGYVVISLPQTNHGPDEEFFGSDHYVEVKDQLFGRYGGLEQLKLLSETTLAMTLSVEVPGVGRNISIATARPMSPEVLRHLQRLERP